MPGKRYICIHGHFYQPPRENPWLETVEIQDSAYPYHDWNERVTAECYAPNARSRILDDEKRIVKITSNYERISFNFGPTLLAWLEKNARGVYDAIIEADRRSRVMFSGHGSAIAQVYNHMIMPLATRRDKYTQAAWGIRDFQYRFGRDPEGLWLPETAADTETLEVVAELGIKLVILSAHQLGRTRRIGDNEWQETNGSPDPRMPYLLRLPSGRSITAFIYDGPVARAVAFERLLSKGESLVQRLLASFDDRRDDPQVVSIATDGETYGHHHRFGDMALAYALEQIDNRHLATITNYGEYLSLHSPTHEATLLERTSWSCAHGVERWRSDCGCNIGSHPGWHQEWRTPLREAFDWLRDTLAVPYEQKATAFLKDPWVARDDYVSIILDFKAENVDRFLAAHQTHVLEPSERVIVRKLLEMQRHLLLMYTSCGWFFDDVSGIETIEVMQCAARAVQLAGEALGMDVERELFKRLEEAKSNVREMQDGAYIYRTMVKPGIIGLRSVCAHEAIRSLFLEHEESPQVHCYDVRREDALRLTSEAGRLAMGRSTVASKITGEQGTFAFAVLHRGDHNVDAGVRAPLNEAESRALTGAAAAAFSEGDILQVARLLEFSFQGLPFSLTSLFRDAQREILGQILEPTLAEAETAFRQFYERYAGLLRFLADGHIRPPEGFHVAARFALHAALRRALTVEEPDWDLVADLVVEARTAGVGLDEAGVSRLFQQACERAGKRFAREPDNLSSLAVWVDAVKKTQALPFGVDLWEVQNTFYDLIPTCYTAFRDRAVRGDPQARTWVDQFEILGRKLSVRID